MTCFSQRTPALIVRLGIGVQRSWMKAAKMSCCGVAMTGAVTGLSTVESGLAKKLWKYTGRPSGSSSYGLRIVTNCPPL